MLKSILFVSLILSVLGLSAGCLQNKKFLDYGYSPQAEIIIKADKATVERTAGEPAFQSLDGKDWYYVKIEITQDNLALHKYYDAEITKVSFDTQDKVTAIDKKIIKDKMPIKVVKQSEFEQKTGVFQSIIDLLKNLNPTL